MKMADYYRHRLNLFVSNEVRFASGDEAVEFMSIYVEESYLKYLHDELLMATTPAEIEDIHNRQTSEGMLVQMYVQDFLYEHLPDTASFRYKLARKFKPAPVYKIDTQDNAQLYEYVLKRLSRTDDVTVDDAFPCVRTAAGLRDIFEIEGNSVVRIN